MSDPRCLAPGLFFGMPLETSKEVMKIYRSGAVPDSVTDEQLWTAQKVYGAAIHPDTGDTVIPPFRMSGFAVFGTPIIVGMLLPNPTIVSTIFWQTLNQSHNAGVNYANRNATGTTTAKDIAVGYVGAVTSAVSIAVGLNQLVARANVSPAMRTMLSRFVPYPAVASASSCNMLLMRRSELDQGIGVKSPSGDELGVSQLAARIAIQQTLITRVVLPAPLLVGPPVSMLAVEKTTNIFKRWPRSRLPIEAGFCVLWFVFGLPLALSCFPQTCEVPVGDLEPRFHNICDSTGKRVEKVVFNKGL